MKKLDLYIIKKFLGTFFFSLILILCIVVVFDVSENLEKFLEHEAPLKAIVFDYYLNFIPYFANLFSSLFIFITVIFFTSKMAYDSEIIAILSTGISFRRLMFPYIFSAMIIAIFSFLMSAFVIPKANKHRNEFEKIYKGKQYANKELNIHRQIAPGTFIYMSAYTVSSNVGYDFAIEDFKDDTLVSKITSSRIVWDRDSSRWVIHNWKRRVIEGDKEVYTTGKRIDTLLNFMPSEFSENPDRIKEQLSYPQLLRYIDQMRLRGSSNVVEFEMEKYKVWANAFATFILTIIGVSIASRKIRGGMGFHLGLGLVISFSYILFMQFSTTFATNGNMNPLLAVWLPNILYSFVAVFAYRTAPK